MKIIPTPFKDTIGWMLNQLSWAPVVAVGEWQGIQNPDFPQTKTIELEDVSFAMIIPQTKEALQGVVDPNLPWAEDHFLERVSGIPLNPPPSSEWWPFATRNNEAFKADEKFSHTYPERMWPKWAGQHVQAAEGIRYSWGDLEDVVDLLRTRPGTRQAYLPIWFPEDTGSVEGQRVPCTLGYHFMVRKNQLKIVYYIRSCDFYRHFRDDVYMAARLAQWMAERLGPAIVVDRLVMHISSLHVFEVERSKVEADKNAWRYYEVEAIRKG
jgi:hypothetical protein